VAFLPLNVSAAKVEAQDFYLSDLKPQATLTFQGFHLKPHLTLTFQECDLKPLLTLQIASRPQSVQWGHKSRLQLRSRYSPFGERHTCRDIVLQTKPSKALKHDSRMFSKSQVKARCSAVDLQARLSRGSGVTMTLSRSMSLCWGTTM